MSYEITCEVQGAKPIMQLFKRETVRLPRKKKKRQKKELLYLLPKEQSNILHYPKTGSTFLFYWHKSKIMMKTLGKMTIVAKSQGTSVCEDFKKNITIPID